MKNIPYFSVLIPVYNVEKYLAECIESVLEQTFSSFEIVLINDGATDNSKEICEKYVAVNDHIQLKSIENSGLSVARNTALELAKGEYVLFLDSDDLLVKDALERLYSYCSDGNLDILFFNAEAFYESGFKSKHLPNYERIVTHSPQSGEDYFYEQVRQESFIPSACLYVHKREVSSTIRFYPGIYHEDNLFTCQLLLVDRSKSVLAIDDKLYLRRMREDSITSVDKRPEHAEGYWVVLNELINMQSQGDLSETASKGMHQYINLIIYHYLNVRIQVARAVRPSPNFISCIKLHPRSILSVRVLITGVLPFIQPILKKTALKLLGR